MPFEFLDGTILEIEKVRVDGAGIHFCMKASITHRSKHRTDACGKAHVPALSKPRP
jgi:hypothetical protein